MAVKLIEDYSLYYSFADPEYEDSYEYVLDYRDLEDWFRSLDRPDKQRIAQAIYDTLDPESKYSNVVDDDDNDFDPNDLNTWSDEDLEEIVLFVGDLEKYLDSYEGSRDLDLVYDYFKDDAYEHYITDPEDYWPYPPRPTSLNF